MMPSRLCFFSLMLCLLSLGSRLQAQPDCGYVEGISYPINRDSFVLAQDYAVASPRHQGRFHTGEDWYGGRGRSLGQPVSAAARGRVTYAYPQGWGRDGGVVILEHTFPDGSIFYTQYGHLMEAGSYVFPTRLACVEQGQIIGAIADVRPAPHLHFEVRLNTADSPSAGYIRENPYAAGFRSPEKFIMNQQAWLDRSHRWHISIGQESTQDEAGLVAPPVVLRDYSLLYLDGAGLTLRRATPDGRVLWRTRLDSPAVAITGWQGNSLLTFANGTMQTVNVETGALLDSWRIDAQFTGAAIETNNRLLLPARNQELIAIAPNRRDILWRVSQIPPLVRYEILPNGTIMLLSHDYELISLTSDGQMLNRVQLRSIAGLGTTPDSALLALTQGGLWRIGVAGEWSLILEDSPHGTETGAILSTPERFYVLAGQALIAYSYDYQKLWQAGLPVIQGRVEIAQYDNIIVLVSNQGQIQLLNADGGFCNQVQIWGQASANQWQDLGADGILRIGLADQLIGLDWATLSRPCRV